MPNGGRNNPNNQFVAKQAQDRNSMQIEPAPNSPGEVIDPKDPNAQRRFQVQQRGGAYSDRVKVDPFKGGTMKRLSRPGMATTRT